MSDTIDYYRSYLELKLHFNSENFIYERDHVSVNQKWNKESETRKEWWRKIKLEMTLSEFCQLTIANLLESPKIYFIKLKKNPNAIRGFRTYWSNHLYYFKKDLETIHGEYYDVWKLQEAEKIRIETIMFLEKLELIDAHSQIIRKYIILMEQKIDWKAIRDVYDSF
jgi:hypothetical protein